MDHRGRTDRRASFGARAIAVLVVPVGVSLMMWSGCGASVPRPEIGEHVDVAKGRCVPYPPPAARVDEVTVRPNAQSFWVDGEWTWDSRQYVWRAGAWAMPSAHDVYARATLIRLPNGSLAYFPGHWHAKGATSAPVDPKVLTVSLHCPTPIGLDAEAIEYTSQDGGADASGDGAKVRADGPIVVTSVASADAGGDATAGRPSGDERGDARATDAESGHASDATGAGAPRDGAADDRSATPEIIQPPP